jgi:DNA-3-methyladenine glycosylase
VNAVTEAKDSPAAVLIRALHPREGLDLMRARRGRGTTAAMADAALCRGPGNLTRALGITLDQNGFDLCRSSLYIADRGDAVDGAIVWGPRIGISVGVEAPWRASVGGHPAVSGVRAPIRRRA